MCPKCGKALFVSADMYTLNAEFRQCICCGYEESIQMVRNGSSLDDIISRVARDPEEGIPPE